MTSTTSQLGAPVHEMPPRGHYFAREVGWLAGVSGHRIGQWKNYGHIRASQEDLDYPNVYAYQDIGEAIIVNELVQNGASLSAVNTAVGVLREEYGYNWPLTHANLVVMGPQALAVEEGEQAYDLTRSVPWQAIIDSRNLIRVARDLRRGGWAAIQMPDLEHIEVDPDRLSGRPAIRGTRVLAVKAGRLAQSSTGRSVLMEEYDLTADEVNDARRWWSAIKSYETKSA